MSPIRFYGAAAEAYFRAWAWRIRATCSLMEGVEFERALEKLLQESASHRQITTDLRRDIECLERELELLRGY
jgi:hypothetical protein